MTERTAHTDIRRDGWINRLLPPPLRRYALLMRLDRPVGTWLLLLPCWWGLLMAGGNAPSVLFLALFALGALLMRSAGCIINDLYDRKLDLLVERTRSRPLASGEVSVRASVSLLLVLLVCAFGVLLCFNPFTVVLGVASLALVVTYPLAKRVTWWPQFVLGLAFNWGAMMGWASLRGQLDAPCLLLYLAGICWTLAYDTIYAHQDKQDDALIGIKSLALYLGDRSRWVLPLFMILFFVLLGLAGWQAGEGPLFFLLLPAAMVHAVWQFASWQMNDPANCLVRFRSNRDLGLLVALALWAGHL